MRAILTLLAVLFEGSSLVFADEDIQQSVAKTNDEVRENTSNSKTTVKNSKVTGFPPLKKENREQIQSLQEQLMVLIAQNEEFKRRIESLEAALSKQKIQNTATTQNEEFKRRIENLGAELGEQKRQNTAIVAQARARKDEETHTSSDESAEYDAKTSVVKKFRRRKPVIMKFFLAVDGENIGNILGEKARSPEDEDKLSADELAIKLAELVDDETIQKIVKQKDEKGFVSLNKISETGVKAKLKMSKLLVNLKIPTDAKKERYMTVSNAKKSKKKSKLQLAKISSVLNGRLAHSENWGTKTDTAIFGPNINIFGLNIESKFDYQRSTNSKSKWTRNLLSAIYDFRESCNRLSAGDVSSYTVDYQSVPKLWGFGFTHFASKEARSLARDLKLEIERPSITKIYVNDVLLKTEKLYPGNYVYNDIPFQYGSNDVKIEITDDTGKVTEKTESFFRDGSMLSSGTFEYGFSFGKPEVSGDNSRYSDKNMGACFLKGGILDSLEGNLGYQKNSVGHMDSVGLNWGNFLRNLREKFSRS